MIDDQMGYNAMVETAMRGVVRDALNMAAKDGLPGEHHFYITFRTDQPGVAIPDHLKQRYPREMTIVLQHQFWNLAVTDEAMEVDLSFNQKLERLRVPLDALITFADPSVNFGLQFQPIGVEDDAAAGAPAADKAPDKKPSAKKSAKTAAEAQAPVKDSPETAEKDGTDGDNVVTLDTFRKK